MYSTAPADWVKLNIEQNVREYLYMSQEFKTYFRLDLSVITPPSADPRLKSLNQTTHDQWFV